MEFHPKINLFVKVKRSGKKGPIKCFFILTTLDNRIKNALEIECGNRILSRIEVHHTFNQSFLSYCHCP